MKTKLSITLSAAVLMLGACSSGDEIKSEAEAEYIEQKTQTIAEYKECVDDAGTDKAKLDACERLLKAVEGIKPAATTTTSAPPPKPPTGTSAATPKPAAPAQPAAETAAAPATTAPAPATTAPAPASTAPAEPAASTTAPPPQDAPQQ